MSKKVKKSRRLFEQFQPEHYELTINPDAKTMTFRGKVVIRGKKTGRPSQRITFHQKALIISKATVTHYDKKSQKLRIDVDRINTHSRYDEMRLHSNKILYPGTYELMLEFEGKITPNMQGLYPCNFRHNGKDKVILATQFESHHAREVFPCIDEPEAKATFDLTVIAPSEQTVLSNMPVRDAKKAGKLTSTSFQTTPKMSVYLLAFAVGNLHFVETKSKGGVTVRSWASVAQPKNSLEYSAKEAADVLDFFTNYFGTAYPLPKLDQLALPDFDAGAMENWGLVTYREIALLTDPVNRSITNEQYVSLVISHELSHQWFGNLVTMKWWDDLWLNESFAGLMEHVAPASLHPDWSQWEHYALSDISLITSRDVYKDIQPVGVEVHDPELIHTLFDPAIVYAKGARLLKMLKDYTGEEAFLSGLRQYFQEHAYGNATRNDLWASLSKSSGKDIDPFMTPWLTQSGMPVLHVKQSARDIELEQERFLLDNSKDDALWPIPLLADSMLDTDLLMAKNHSLKASKEFVVFNPNASGQFITHYTNPAHNKHVAQALANKSVPPEARINILNDYYMLARKGMNSITDSLDLVLSAKTEDRDSVWGLMIRVLAGASQITEGDKTAESQIKQLKVHLAKDWHAKLGWESHTKDKPNTLQLRHTMLALMVSGENKQTIEKAIKKFSTSKDISQIDAEMRATVLSAAVRFGHKQNITSLIGVYPQASPELQHDISGALASTKDSTQAKEIIDQALGPKGFVRAQDVMRWVALFLRNYYTRSVMWDWMVNNWDWLAVTLQNSKAFDYMPTYTAAVISTKADARKYKDLFEPQLTNKTLQRNIKIGLADIEGRVAWRERDEPAIKKWLTKRI